MKKYIALCLSLFFALSIFGQVEGLGEGTGSVLVIAEVEFLVDGATKDFLLREKADIEIGRRFPSLEALETFLADRRQVLLNERVLQEVSVSYELREALREETEVVVSVWVKDSWNIIALPYFRFDSNSGLLLSIRGRDYNFLGSMQTLVLNFDYTYDENGRSGFGGYTSFSLPFQLGDFLLSLGLSEDLLIYADDTPTFNSAAVNASATYKGFGFPLTASLSQGLSTNPDGVANDSDPYFMTSSLGFSASFEGGRELWRRGPLVYSPSLSLAQSWRFEAPVRPDRQGLVITLGQSLSWGRADWNGNIKDGLTASLSNTNYLYLRDGSWVLDADASLNYFASYAERVGLKLRSQLFYRAFGGVREDLGGSLRGVMNARVDGNTGVFLNLDVPIKLFDFPTHLVIKKDWLDFELQASPFLDAAYVLPEANAVPSLEDLWLAGGLEFLVFPFRMRSFIVRASVGFDLRNVLETKSLTAETPDGTSPYELFFGLGLLY